MPKDIARQGWSPQKEERYLIRGASLYFSFIFLYFSREGTDILARIARLYHEVETPCAHASPEERRRRRQEHAAPILAGIFEKLEELRSQTIPSEPLRRTVEYALNQRQGLCRYLEDGRLRPDNNLAENAMRPGARGRKN
ncbi:MAG: Transposase IS66 family protein [Syntrophus sp. PtaU1.Bin208]|nr:MAG: Transposase IS66 family protein [Syntrophus sp. PtaU1.Bin208]